MDDTSKYIIHAAITANGVVERSDVVGAIFGQTEGLLGEELDLRTLQQSSKVGRIDVEVTSEGGQSFGEVTIASSLDRVRTAIVAAALETITRVGPCRARIEVTEIEDVLEAKRREVVNRAKELLADSFDESVMTSEEIREEVREAVRVGNIGEYAGLPAGPRVGDSDAVVVVEGRADVLTLLKYGVKNAIAVEGTDIPDAVADLTADRTVTAFFDGDRGGELILRELAQIGDVDYVAFAPEGRSVEDLARHEVMDALRAKVPIGRLSEDGEIRTDLDADAADDAPLPRNGASGAEAPAAGEPASDAVSEVAATVGDAGTEPVTEPVATSEAPPDDATAAESATSVDVDDRPADADDEGTACAAGDETGTADADAPGDRDRPVEATASAGTTADGSADVSGAGSLGEHVREVVDAETGRVRLLDDGFGTLDEADAADAFDAIERADPAPFAVVVDGGLSQRMLDIAAQRGVEHVVARTTGEFVKRPVDVRVRTADQLA
jgi:DNA primase